jgi:hypothetical protein
LAAYIYSICFICISVNTYKVCILQKICLQEQKHSFSTSIKVGGTMEHFGCNELIPVLLAVPPVVA